MVRLGSLIVLGSLALAGCASESAAPVSQRPAPTRYAPLPIARRIIPPTAHVQSLPGLEGVIGAGADDLQHQFGTARLDVREGDARKLQFTGSACVLDVYLYPLAPGRDAQATYVDARRADGRDVDRAACVAALRRR